MVQKPINSENKDGTPRSKSSLMPTRRRRDQRKKSAELNSRRSIHQTNRLSTYKAAKSAFSIISGPERIEQLTEVTTNETYASNTSTSTVTQLKN
jgi:hypothetical protein